MEQTLTKIALVIAFCAVALAFADTAKTVFYGDLIDAVETSHQQGKGNQ